MIWIYSIPNYAQSVGIGTTDPNANAALHIVSPSNNQGILVPNLTTDQRTNSEFISNLTTADNGLLVFDITTNNFYFWLDDDWEPIVSGTVGQNLSAGIGMQITNNQIINTGDTDSTDDITINTPAEGALTGFYPAPELAEGSVGTTNLEDSAVTGNKISDNTIGVQKLVGLSDPTSGRNSLLITNNSNLPRWFQPSLNQVIVTDNAGQISSRPIGSFTQTLLPEGNIFIGDINGDANVLDASNNGRILIGNGTTVVSVPMMGDLSVDASGTATIQPNAITSAEIADNSITSGDLADLTITSAKIAANAIESSNIADGTIQSTDLSDGTILTTKIANDAVQSNQILDGTIANADLAAGAVNSTSIEDETIVNADVAATAGIEVQKLETMATGTIMFGNSGVPTIGVLQGDATIDNSGNLTIGTLTSVDIDGGTIDNTIIGGATPADGTFTNLSASDGSGIQNLNASSISTGTLNSNQLPNNIIPAGSFGDATNFINTITIDDKGRVTNVTVGDPTAPSDLRLKTDLNKISYSPQLLNKLQAYRYYWKDGKFGEDVQIGLIAQDVEKVYPELVKLRSDGYKGVVYNGFIPILVEATKTQQSTIDALETENQGLINTIEIINHKLDEQNEKILMLEELVRKMLKENSSTSDPVTQTETEEMGRTNR
ncbi:MAG: tail fiber domain-containing protein [Bacteroidota bacterium]